MFIGHFGIGFGAKKYAPALSLGILMIAAQFLDLLWPNLLLLDVEHVLITPGITEVTPLDFTDYPYSHSLIWVVGWGLLLGLITKLFLKRTKLAVIIFFCVISHWFLDLLVHRPDLPLTPDAVNKYGFGLWNYPTISLVLEFVIFLGGAYMYSKITTAKNKFGKYGLFSLVVLLGFIQIANNYGPPPPNVDALMWSAQLQWLFVILAFFIDKNRVSASSTS